MNLNGIVTLGMLAFVLLLSACAESEENQTTDEKETAVDSGNHEHSYPENDVMDLYLYAEDTTLEHLYDRDPESDDRVNGYIKLDPDSDERLMLDGFRFRGNSARHLPKKSFNIRFDEEQAFLFDSNRMNLNGMYRDPSMMREKLSWAMFEELGLPAPRARYFNLYINDRFEGLYVHVERVDEDLLTHHSLNPDGTLVRDRMRHLFDDPEANYDNRSTFSEDVTEMSEPALELDRIFDSRNKPNFKALYDLLEGVQGAKAGPEFAQVFDEFFDAEQFIDWFAVHYLIGDIDAFGDDYWLYNDHESPDSKWLMIPWDKNLTFGSYTREQGGITNDYFHYEYENFELWENGLIIKFLNTSQLMDRFYDRVEELMTNTFPPQYFHNRVAEYRPVIEDHVRKEPSDNAFHFHTANHFGELSHYTDRLETVTEYIELRYEFIRAGLNREERDDQAAYEASANQFESGERTYFTDDRGFVMGYVIPENVTGDPAVQLTIEENDAVYGIDRDYRFDVDGGSIEGEWAFYYRNDIGWLSKGNWYLEDEPVGRQYDLQAVVLNSGPLESSVNPYVNRLITSMTLDRETVIQLTLDREE